MQAKQIIYHFLYFAVTHLLINTLDFAAKLELSEVFAIASPHIVSSKEEISSGHYFETNNKNSITMPN